MNIENTVQPVLWNKVTSFSQIAYNKFPKNLWIVWTMGLVIHRHEQKKGCGFKKRILKKQKQSYINQVLQRPDWMINWHKDCFQQFLKASKF